ncbi:OFA family MFS transporter [Dissulfurirhabdus thermomarina]|uniref:OFA family MFS transporter n=1 Tax=Dissulfurirhabdus thermomarina TaxID=1765737 RepID=A0A6N9TRZ4_DISTH|nr:OFA family MFS transporter [Dissulfurirhabdus thermomarina]NDY42873.1 OFA family MFS transporter [Dissulfurirhabdus thermomarina]NMX24430.1 OFA family MFS transporter [Dissulfurirhabdus thermomarina]
MAGLLSKERIVARPGFNRWLVPPASVAIHLCIGSVYAWSIYNPALVKALGVVTSAAGDWSIRDVVWVFTVAIVFLGLSAAFAGKWLEEVGPRKVGVVAALCWGGGYLVGGLGILLHRLWLVYLGYGVIGGCGLGLGYVSPVSTLIRWFPDRRGMATGMAIMGFGGGAMIGAPLKEFLIRHFYRAPEYLGPVDAVHLVTQGGKRFAEVAGTLREVVVVGARDLAGMIQPGPEGVYLVGTGSVGVAETFFALGLLYAVVMLAAAFSYRIPPPGWKPEGWIPLDHDQAARKMITREHVHIDQALKTPQFYQLWLILCLNVTAGIGVLGVAKTMMTEIFGTTLPHVVDGAFAATYVMMISVFNMTGRFFWASVSDYLGRKRTFALFFVLGIVLYLSIPWCARGVSANPSVVWLVYFYAATMLIFTMYGGGFSTIPAYLADVFGTKFVGGIHGRILTAWSTAGVLGPLAITSFRERSLHRAIEALAAKVDPEAFRRAFGAGIDQLDLLVRQKTVTVAKLMEIAPAGTPDPTSGLYNTTMFLMAGLLAVAFVVNALMRPVDPRHHLREED